MNRSSRKKGIPIYQIATLTLALIGPTCLVGASVESSVSVNAISDYVTPPDIGDGWDTAHVSEVGLNMEIIDRMIDRIRDGTYPNIHSVLIVKDGKLVFEDYFPGVDSYSGRQTNFDRNTLHQLFSVTKSLNSALVGIAIDRGLISGVDAYIRDLYPKHAYGDIFSDLPKRQIRLKDMLSMTSGLHWDEWTYPYTDSRNDHVQMNNSPDQIRFVLSRPMASVPGDRFQYNSGVSIAIGGIVSDVSSTRVDYFAEEFLLRPLGITAFDWYRYPSGIVQTGGGLRMRPRDMAKFGYLFLNGGRWKNNQIVPESWVLESTKIHVPKPTIGYDYGYQWWIRTFDVNGRPEKVISADGRGGQFIFMVPSLNLVAVFTGWNDNRQWARPIVLLRDYLIPASVSVSPLVESGSVHSPEQWQDLVHPSGVLYNEGLLNGTAVSVVAAEGKVMRLMYEDLNDDIVWVDFFGEGTLTIELEEVPYLLRKPPSKYTETASYTKGHASMGVEGATEDTYLSVYTLGPWNGDDASMFPFGEIYDGRADLKSLQISGTGMGGLYLGNARFSGSSGLVGIDASDVPIMGRVAIGGIAASGDGEPMLLIGGGSELSWDDGKILVAGSTLEQPNGRPIVTGGFDSILSIAVNDSNGVAIPAHEIVANFVDPDGESVEPFLSVDEDQGDFNLSAFFVSELLGSGYSSVPTLEPIADRVVGLESFALPATISDARVPVVFSVSSGHARIEDGNVILTGAGEVVLEATVPKTPFSEAVSAEQRFFVSEIDPEGDEDGDGATPAPSRLLNLSSRGTAGTGDNTQIVGFVVSPGEDKQVLVRAVGPSLRNFGVTTALANPAVTIFDADGNALGINDDWVEAEVGAAMISVGAFALDTGSADAAIIMTLPAGAYTAQVGNDSGVDGVVLVEIYEVSN